MFFSSGSSKKGKSYYTVREYRDVVDEHGNVKSKRIQTKVGLIAGHQAVDGPQSSSEISDSSEDESDHVYHDLEMPHLVDEESICTGHQKRKENNAQHWQALRSKLVKITLTTEGFPSYSSTCSRCSEGTAIYRCFDCGGAGLSMCEGCCHQLHEYENIFHVPDVWQDEEWKPYIFPKELVQPFHNCSNGNERKMITVVDSKGRHHDVSIAFCQCETPGETLVRLHLWPATPCNPSLAFTWELLSRLQSLMFECQVSVYDYVKHLNFYNTIFDKNRTIYRQLLESYEEFRYHWKAKENCYLDNDELVITMNPLQCPACPTGSGQLPADAFMSADACFGLPRKKSRSKSYQQPLSSGMYFLPQPEVDSFMECYPKSTKDHEEDCSDFQAGSVIRSKGRYVALDETAVFGIACKHSFPWKFLNVKGGERIGYVVFMMIKLVENSHRTRNKVKLMYDICCQLRKHLEKQGRKDLLEKFDLGCPQFHAYAHGADCQIQFSPRRLAGWGLCDGEVMERLWSYLGRFKKMTKEMSSSHREDILNDALHFHALHQKNRIVLTILQRHKDAIKRQNEAKVTLQDLQDICNETLSDKVLLEWQREEKEILSRKKPLRVDLGEHGWVTSYLQLLRTFYALREEVVLEESEVSMAKIGRIAQELTKMEKTYSIKTRWKPTDQTFKSALITSEASKATTFLDLLRMSGRRRWFLLSLMKKYADGQRQSQRIIKAISRESKVLQEHLKKYNASVQVLREQGLDFKILSWEQACDANGDLYSHRTTESSTPLNALQAWKRDALEAFTLLQRAKEEISITKVEMSTVIQSLYADCTNIASIQSTINEQQSTAMVAGLLSIIKNIKRKQYKQLCFAVRSFSNCIDIPGNISALATSTSYFRSLENAEDLNIDSDEECNIYDATEIQSDATSCYVEKDDYLFDDQASDCDFGTGC